MTRKEAREAAFLLLFEQSFGANAADGTLQLAEAERELKISGFGRGLFFGAAEHLAEIDERLDKALHNWQSGRVSRVALTAMRLCVYEMCFTETESEVAINEAIELIKKFDGEESASFANGVLGGVYKAEKENT